MVTSHGEGREGLPGGDRNNWGHCCAILKITPAYSLPGVSAEGAGVQNSSTDGFQLDPARNTG
eukprot:CAMPEP_0115718818 /NCGR_PEP_ID=MMETSP0272-20121206/77643_1 /TAXON_ID=71861 /ORGANISM="Scrippsiella trochoidea, Strain CCMP3099" /LENGTH=62 /DNA_ID=CAMNT_0003161391 /DNA_START=66 /DNA_END=254 /DNA_ORIENTATION=+